MLALLSNCVGRLSLMSVFHRFWSRAAKRGRKANGGRSAGSLEAADDSEFVRVEGRAKTRAKLAEGGEDREKHEQLHRIATNSSPPTSNSKQKQQQLAPVIRIEQSESVECSSSSPVELAVDLNKDQNELEESGGQLQQHQERRGSAEKEINSNRKKDASFTSIELRSHRSVNSATGVARPSSSIHGEADLQMCLGKPCARLRLSVQYSEQKKLLILTLHELAQTEELWLVERRDERAALQVRLALLTDGQQPSKVQKFQSKFQPLDQFQVHYGQTFAFDCAREQLAGSVVRLRLYRKCREQRRPHCLGVAFLRNYLVDTEAHKAQNHFLQFRRSLVEPKSAKGSMSLFPSLLSLTHSQHREQQQPNNSGNDNNNQQQQTKSPPIGLSLPGPVNPTLANVQQQSSIPMTPQSASSSRRGSTVDEESGRFCALPQMGGNQPEMLLSLCYYEAQNRLVIGVEKAAAIGHKEEQIFVRITAHSPNGAERGKHKSECVLANSSGETQFNAQAAFHVPRSELAQTSVKVQLFAVQSGGWSLLKRKQHPIGRLTLSQQSAQCSSPDAQTHWREMIQGMGITVDKWHVLELIKQEVNGAAPK